MECGCELKDSTFGGPKYCGVCGMDLGMNPVVSKKKGVKEYYCCAGCADIR
ncbi:TPA: hypothetical protein HA265_06190 [Candidatus Woesearchaeota archaeon]|nr:hypothetical protein [Candidatus Woesearchaeota archaeon]